MANSYNTTPDNFNAGTDETKVTRYLDLAGLTTFWGKVKEYVDTQDDKIWTAAKGKIDADDTKVRSYIESLTVNGVEVTSNKTANADGEGTELSVTINAGDIAATYGEGENSTVQSAISDIDTRLDGVEIELQEGVVNKLTVNVTHSTVGEGEAAVEKAWVDVNELSGATGDVTITVDDTAIHEKFVGIDEDIATLTANAGVTNIAVKDVDAEIGNNKGLVEISLSGSKAPVNVGADYVGDGSYRGDILITLDETALDEKLDTVDALVADEIADRKADSIFLAGDNAEINGDGKLAWKTGATQNYKDLTAVSTRLDEIDTNLVTTIVESGSVENYVTFDVEATSTDGSNDKSVTLTINDTKLKEYTDNNENNLKSLNGLSVNGKQIISATVAEGASQVSVSGTSITLSTEDIKRADGTTVLEEQLEEYDEKIAALASATHFRGVTESTITDGGTESVTIGGVTLEPEDGDIVISMNSDGDEGKSREYIWSGGKWYELGDTTAEAARLTAVETWINTKFITNDDINGLDWTAQSFS